jgi:hypothetical protein
MHKSMVESLPYKVSRWKFRLIQERIARFSAQWCVPIWNCPERFPESLVNEITRRESKA